MATTWSLIGVFTVTCKLNFADKVLYILLQIAYKKNLKHFEVAYHENAVITFDCYNQDILDAMWLLTFLNALVVDAECAVKVCHQQSSKW